MSNIPIRNIGIIGPPPHILIPHILISNRLFLIGGLLFVLAAYIYRQTIISIGNLSIANIIWQVATILLVTLLSVCVFKETLTSNQWLGIGLVIIGIVLITYKTE